MLAKEYRQITTFIINDNRSSNNSRVIPHRPDHSGLKVLEPPKCFGAGCVPGIENHAIP
jgi:hypothetical protein